MYQIFVYDKPISDQMFHRLMKEIENRTSGFRASSSAVPGENSYKDLVDRALAHLGIK